MPTFRTTALEDVFHRKPLEVKAPSGKVSDYYGQNVFNQSTMREYLTDEAYDSVMDSMINGSRIDRGIADQVGSSMKDWAMSRGATHYTHSREA
jgi:glutamine synthetase